MPPVMMMRIVRATMRVIRSTLHGDGLQRIGRANPNDAFALQTDAERCAAVVPTASFRIRTMVA